MSWILIVEDDLQLTKLLKLLLERQGYAVNTAPDGDLALRTLRERPFDLVIVDLVLPGTSGLEVIGMLRQEHLKVKIIAITGGGPGRPDPLLMLAEKRGANRVLHKPFHPAELLDDVAELLRVGEGAGTAE